MCRKARTLPLVSLLCCPLILVGAMTFAFAQQQGTSEEPAESEDQAAGEQPAEVEPATQPDIPAKPQLSPEMLALRDQVQKALALIAKQPLNTRDNTPGELLQFSLAFGCDTNVGYGGPSAKKVNAIACLCANLPCAGYRLLRTDDDQVMARIGCALQSHPAEFLAVLAQSRVPADYHFQAGEFRGSVADLVEFEKRNLRSGTDLSFTLIGLAHYLKEEPVWKNDLGEEWSIERLVREELARKTGASGSKVTDRLMGLSYAIDRRTKRERPLDGPFLLAQQYISRYHDYALEAQNPDGTWHPSFFGHKGSSRDTAGLLRSTGHIFEWLAFSLPEDRLADPGVVRSVAYLTKILGDRRSRWNTASMTFPEIGGLMHAAHGLAIYDRRVFEPRAAKPEEEEPETKEPEVEQR